MTDWIDVRLNLKSGIVFILAKVGVAIADGRGGAGVRAPLVRMDPHTAAEASELSIALKRAQRRMDQLWREMRAAEEDAKTGP